MRSELSRKFRIKVIMRATGFGATKHTRLTYVLERIYRTKGRVRKDALISTEDLVAELP